MDIVCVDANSIGLDSAVETAAIQTFTCLCRLNKYRLHWVKDVALNEDNDIFRGGNAPGNWAMGDTIFSSISSHERNSYFPRSFKIDG